MTAGINDHFTEATNGTRPVPSVLSAIKSIGAASLSANALTGWPTNTSVHFILYNIDTNSNKVAGTQSDFKGIVSGNTITTIVLKAGNDANYAIGTVIEASPTASWANDMADGIIVEHLQSGTHGAITPTSVVSAGSGSFATGVTDSGIPLATTKSDIISNYVISGGVVALVSGLNGSFSNIVWYAAGVRSTKTGVANNAYSINQDTYVDISPAGTVNYTGVANGTASPALTAGNVRVAKVITNGVTITSVVQYGVDSLNNSIYPINLNGYNGWIEYSGISTIVGWASFTTKSIKYMKIGKTLMVIFTLDGTSNSTLASFTLPFSQNALTAGGIGLDASTGLIIDNGAVQGSPGRIYIDSSVNAALVNLLKTPLVSWTNTGTKSVRGQFFFEVQ